MIGLLNPRVMQNKAGAEQDHGTSFCIESEASFLQIGFAADFDVCRGHSVKPNTSENVPCYNFVNGSVERLCERHKFELNTAKLNRFKAARIGCLSERVDFNEMRRHSKMNNEDKFGCFGANTLKRDHRPKPQKTLVEQKYNAERKVKEQKKLQELTDRRQNRADGKDRTVNSLNLLNCTEVNHIKTKDTMPSAKT